MRAVRTPEAETTKLVRNCDTLGSHKNQPYGNVAANRIGIRAYGVRMFDQPIGIGTRDSRKGNPELNLHSEPARCRTYSDADLDLGIHWDVHALAQSDEPHHL